MEYKLYQCIVIHDSFKTLCVSKKPILNKDIYEKWNLSEQDSNFISGNFTKLLIIWPIPQTEPTLFFVAITLKLGWLGNLVCEKQGYFITLHLEYWIAALVTWC